MCAGAVPVLVSAVIWSFLVVVSGCFCLCVWLGVMADNGMAFLNNSAVFGGVSRMRESIRVSGVLVFAVMARMALYLRLCLSCFCVWV